MELFRSVGSTETMPTLFGDSVMLRPPNMNDHPEWSSLRSESRAFLKPFEPTWPSDDLSKTAFRRRIRRYQREIREDTGYPFFVFSLDGELMGGVTLSHVRRGVTQACSMGYWMGQKYAGRGFMTRAVRAIVPFAFETLSLHRVEAACLPHNPASIRLLEKVGFAREGYARRYLCIDGRWQDHLLYALLADDDTAKRLLAAAKKC